MEGSSLHILESRNRVRGGAREDETVCAAAPLAPAPCPLWQLPSLSSHIRTKPKHWLLCGTECPLNPMPPSWCGSVVECRPMHQEVNLIPSQGTYLGYEPDPQWGHAGGGHQCSLSSVFLSLSPSCSKNQ
uniref:Uncharacterized protein n=1 Tax=Molossus molossus TaxID=27622 RepID=A0A7J8EEB6_MOLMO|nr:hypothetical protein HJG59_008814 [Molossus molossus]